MRLGLVLREAFVGMRRNFSMVLTVILVTFVSLGFVGAAMLLQMQIGQMRGYWYDRAQVAVYLCTKTAHSATCPNGETTDAQKQAIQDKLSSSVLAPYVSKVYFEDHQQAYDNFLKQFSGTQAAQFVTADQLNEAYWVSLKNPSQSDVIVEALGNQTGVEQVFDQRKFLEPIFSALNVATYTAVGIAAIMLLAAALLIATTIRLSAVTRSREIRIMRLVGASNGLIQAPFVLEGVFAALIGAIMAGGALLAVVVYYLQGTVAPGLGIALVGTKELWLVIPILIGIAIVLAAISASVAIRRHLRA